MVSTTRKLRYVDLTLSIEGRCQNTRSADRGIGVIRVLGRVMDKSLVRDARAGRIFHLHGEVGPRVDGVGHAIRIRDLVHVDFIQLDLDADAGSALRILD